MQEQLPRDAQREASLGVIGKAVDTGFFQFFFSIRKSIPTSCYNRLSRNLDNNSRGQSNENVQT